MEPLTTTANKWTFIQRIFFFFFFVYFVLFCFPFPFDSFEFSMPVAKPFHNFKNWLIPNVGKYFFGIKTPFEEASEITYWLVHMFSIFLLSLLITAIWTVFDRKRLNYEKLEKWLLLYLRFYLAFVMFTYGMHKVFPMQGGFITVSSLEKPIGMLVPADLHWKFLAYSNAYKIFSGLIEMAGGLLILWRRTATLGALILMGVLSIVVVLNFCFDINMKFPSLHYLLITLIILWKDRQRLVNLFILNRPTVPQVYVPLIRSPKWSRVLSVFLISLVICKLYQKTEINNKHWKSVSAFDKRPLYGIYTTDYFIRGIDTTLPLQSDSLRWKKITIETETYWGPPRVYIHLSTDSIISSQVQIDTIQKTIQFEIMKDSLKLNWSKPDSNHLFFSGKWKHDFIQVMMKKYDLNNYPLHREKFK